MHIMNPQLSLSNPSTTTISSQENQKEASSSSDSECEDIINIESLTSVSTEADDSSNMVEALSKVFYVGAKFRSMEELRGTAQALGSQFNCPITTAKSSKDSYIVLQCKHSGNYRKARKIVKEKEREEEEEEAKKRARHHRSSRIQCPLRIYASIGRDYDKRWEIRQATLEHNHDLSSDLTTYAKFRKLAPKDFRFACDMMRRGETPSAVLKVLTEKGVHKGVTASDLHNIQQRFCRNIFSDRPEFISNSAHLDHQAQTMTDSDERVSANIKFQSRRLQGLIPYLTAEEKLRLANDLNALFNKYAKD